MPKWNAKINGHAVNGERRTASRPSLEDPKVTLAFARMLEDAEFNARQVRKTQAALIERAAELKNSTKVR